MAALPAWPPQVTTEAQAALTDLAIDYALSHSLVLRPPPTGEGSDKRPSQSSVIHAPVALFPTPFPRSCFELASRLQSAYNALYAHVASDSAFLHRIIGTSVAHVDDFTGSLYKIYCAVRDDATGPQAQTWQLGLFRSDYLLHSEEDGSGLGIRQVEFNTISSSFGPLSTKTSDMHRYLASIEAFPSDSPIRLASLPPNKALDALAAGLAAGHQAYLSSRSSSAPKDRPPVVLMVVQPVERNAFDQRLLEYALLENHGVKMIRVSFGDLATAAQVSTDAERKLLLKLSDGAEPLEVSVVYYRAGYTPNDYPSLTEWDTRLRIERSVAIKCPSVGLQLAGAKKVQQVLAEPGELEAFLERGSVRLLDRPKTVLSKADAALLRKSWTEMYPMDDSPRGQEGRRLASNPATAKDYVLKPQREGGGNNIYGLKIPPALAEMEKRDAERAKAAKEGETGQPKEREAYILMSMIRPPQDLRNLLLRYSPSSSRSEAVLGEVISELGMYGVVVFRENDEEGRGGAEIMVNEGDAGHLLRTKASAAEEGGVAVGISCLDSPLLV